MRFARALRFKGYVTSESTGHATRSTTGAMHFDILAERIVDSVLKPANSHSGPKLLVNELVSTEIAYRLGLPSPEPFVVEVPADAAIPLRHTRGYVAAGPNYAVPYFCSGVAPIDLEHVHRSDNASDLAGVVIFDTWIGNRDRTTPGNLVATRSSRRSDGCHIWMIDHGHAFTGPDWTAASLEEEALRVDRLPYLDIMHDPLCETGSLLHWLARIRALTEAEIAAIVALVPEQWLPDRVEREALVYYLAQRQDALAEAFIGCPDSSLAS